MNKIFIYSLCAFLISCSQNPFGENSSSSCDHAPNAQVGLPVSCQVSLSNTENLALWLDANERSTVVTSSLDVDSFLDKSGKGNNLIFATGVKSSIKQAAVNDRDSLLFNGLNGEYARFTDFNSAIPAGSSFSFFAAFKIKTALNNTLVISNNDDFNLSIKKGAVFEYHIGSGIKESFQGFNISDVVKVAIIFDAATSSSKFYLNGVKINEGSFQPALLPWTQFSISGNQETELMELLIYSIHTNETERKEVEGYLNNKWGF